MSRILILLSILIAAALKVAAQVPITVKNNFLYVDAMLSSKDKSTCVSAIIDTGCTYCMIDSTFAEGFKLPTINTASISYNTEKKPIQGYWIKLPQLSVGEKVYSNVYCVVVDLQGKFKEYAPSFIIGANVLSRDLWNVNLENNTLSFLSELPQQSKKIKWVARKATFANEIILKAEVNGKSGYFLLDTGSRRNLLPQALGIASTRSVQETTANIAETISIKELQVVDLAQLQVGFINKTIDMMYLTLEKEGTLNTQFLQGKSIVLDYKKKCIFVLE